jgi:hypothetical protein
MAPVDDAARYEFFLVQRELSENIAAWAHSEPCHQAMMQRQIILFIQ